MGEAETFELDIGSAWVVEQSDAIAEQRLSVLYLGYAKLSLITQPLRYGNGVEAPTRAVAVIIGVVIARPHFLASVVAHERF